MKTVKIVSTALFSAFLAACGGGGGGGGNAVRPDPPPPAPTPDPSPAPGSSLSEVPGQYRDIVSNAKTISLIENDNGDIYEFTIGDKTGEYNFSDLPNGVTRTRRSCPGLRDTTGVSTALFGRVRANLDTGFW